MIIGLFNQHMIISGLLKKAGFSVLLTKTHKNTNKNNKI